MKHGSAEAKAKHYLIIGPWDHAGTRTPKKEVGGLVFGDASVLDLNQLHKQWYDWTMKSGAKPEFLKDARGLLRHGSRPVEICRRSCSHRENDAYAVSAIKRDRRGYFPFGQPGG